MAFGAPSLGVGAPLAVPDETLEALHPLVTAIVRQTSRRYLLSCDEQEELRSHVFLKLLENDCHRLRGFRGESSLRTYLVVVIKRLYVDLRIEQCGKWRPSAAAKRGGDVFERVEELVYRRGYSASQAHEYLTTNLGYNLTVTEFDDIIARLPLRGGPTVETGDDLDTIADDRYRPDVSLRATEAEQRTAQLMKIWAAFANKLDGEDRLIWALYFDDQVKSSTIAHALRCPVQHVYSRVERIKQAARAYLEEAGITANVLRGEFDRDDAVRCREK